MRSKRSDPNRYCLRSAASKEALLRSISRRRGPGVPTTFWRCSGISTYTLGDTGERRGDRQRGSVGEDGGALPGA